MKYREKLVWNTLSCRPSWKLEDMMDFTLVNEIDLQSTGQEAIIGFRITSCTFFLSASTTNFWGPWVPLPLVPKLILQTTKQKWLLPGGLARIPSPFYCHVLSSITPASLVLDSRLSTTTLSLGVCSINNVWDIQQNPTLNWCFIHCYYSYQDWKIPTPTTSGEI